MPATFCVRTAFDKSQAWKSCSPVCSFPVAIHEQGKQPHQQYQTLFYATEGQRTQEEGPDISLLDPALQKQWDQGANAYLGKIVIKPNSNRKVQWTCDQCPDGYLHSWSASIQHRSAGSGCPQCIGRKVCKHNSLATKAPEFAAQWDYEENDGTPDDVVAQSIQIIGWLCEAYGHKWTARISSRVSKNSGCPLCAQIARTKGTKRPTFAECQVPKMRALLAQWDHERNATENNFPDNTTLQSSKRIHWLCTKCSAGQQHCWSASPDKRTCRLGTGCPFCAGRAACSCNSLQARYPAVAAEWDHGKNTGQPSDYPASSHRLAWWLSPQRGSWQQTIKSRTSIVQQRTARLQRVQQRQNAAS